MSLGEEIRFDLISIIEDDPATFQFKGREFRGTCSGINASKSLDVGGFDERPELTIAINLRDANGATVFGQDRPKIGEKLTYRQTEYRIDSTEIDHFEEALQMNLRSKHI